MAELGRFPPDALNVVDPRFVGGIPSGLFVHSSTKETDYEIEKYEVKTDF